MSKKEKIKEIIIDMESDFDSFMDEFENLDSYLEGDSLSDEEKRIIFEEFEEEDYLEIAFKIAENLYLEGNRRVKLK